MQKCHFPQVVLSTYLVGLLHLAKVDLSLLVFAPFVLEPHPNHSRAQSSHFHHLLLHERVWPRVGVVAGAQRVELLLVQHRPDSGRLAVPLLLLLVCLGLDIFFTGI